VTNTTLQSKGLKKCAPALWIRGDNRRPGENTGGQEKNTGDQEKNTGDQEKIRQEIRS
jgi:hypothetical protein